MSRIKFKKSSFQLFFSVALHTRRGAVIPNYYVETLKIPADDPPLSRSFEMADRQHPPGGLVYNLLTVSNKKPHR